MKGVNVGKVILILIVLIIAGVIFLLTQKDGIQAISLWLGEVLNPDKIKVTIGPAGPAKPKAPVIIKLEKPKLKPSAKFAFHYKLYGKNQDVTNGETVHWQLVSADETQSTWESEDHNIEAYSANPFLPPLSAPVGLFNKTARLDYLSTSEIFPLTSSEPKVVRIQDRSATDSKPYNWSCLITGEETVAVMAGEYPVTVVTCVISGGKEGVETYKYSKLHNHWIYRERSGFAEPRLSVELVSYSD